MNSFIVWLGSMGIGRIILAVGFVIVMIGGGIGVATGDLTKEEMRELADSIIQLFPDNPEMPLTMEGPMVVPDQP